MTPAEVLALPMEDDDSGATSVGHYLSRLLEVLWIEGEAFSGKRPFGNSGWQFDVYAALIRGGAVAGSFDEDGFIRDLDEPAAEALVLSCIRRLTDPQKLEVPGE